MHQINYGAWCTIQKKKLDYRVPLFHSAPTTIVSSLLYVGILLFHLDLGVSLSLSLSLSYTHTHTHPHTTHTPTSHLSHPPSCIHHRQLFLLAKVISLRDHLQKHLKKLALMPNLELVQLQIDKRAPRVPHKFGILL